MKPTTSSISMMTLSLFLKTSLPMINKKLKILKKRKKKSRVKSLLRQKRSKLLSKLKIQRTMWNRMTLKCHQFKTLK